MDSYSRFSYALVKHIPDETDPVLCTNISFIIFHICLVLFHSYSWILTYFNVINPAWIFPLSFSIMLIIVALFICFHDFRIINVYDDKFALILDWRLFWAMVFFIPTCIDIILSIIGFIKLCYYNAWHN
ncbi:hypothetical protein DFJ63DRAFT_334777 [Scheffersomyces coipomensis]|uniref:uncharacterized protein n=1 Tax=Scheffersomyces coipomensis TaxID=1788519 RepID=UPI00315D6105